MPRNPEFMDICSPEKTKCVMEALTVVEETAFDAEHDSHRECHCLPSCADFEFPHMASMSRLNSGKMLHIDEDIVEARPHYKNETYVKRNLALVHVYFDKLHFISKERGIFFGFVDFFSNVGGLIGLCTGLSAISVLEIGYFFTMRLFFNKKMGRGEYLY